jgi:hypothetical protein
VAGAGHYLDQQMRLVVDNTKKSAISYEMVFFCLVIGVSAWIFSSDTFKPILQWIIQAESSHVRSRGGR